MMQGPPPAPAPEPAAGIPEPLPLQNSEDKMDELCALNRNEPMNPQELKDSDYTIHAEFPDKISGVTFVITKGVMMLHTNELLQRVTG